MQVIAEDLPELVADEEKEGGIEEGLDIQDEEAAQQCTIEGEQEEQLDLLYEVGSLLYLNSCLITLN